MRITDGMRFRAMEKLMKQTPEQNASMRDNLDELITDLKKKDHNAFIALVRAAGPDFEHTVEVNPWDIFGLRFNTYVQWGQNTIGFGQYSISVHREEDEVVITASNENMSVAWQKRLLHDMIERLFSHVPDDVNFDELSDGLRIKVPQEVLNHEKKLGAFTSGEEQQEPQQQEQNGANDA